MAAATGVDCATFVLEAVIVELEEDDVAEAGLGVEDGATEGVGVATTGGFPFVLDLPGEEEAGPVALTEGCCTPCSVFAF